MKTFEEIYQAIVGLEKPLQSEQRYLEWCGTEKVIAVAKRKSGGIEIFIRAPAFNARFESVRRHLEFGSWTNENEDVFEANRIILRSDEHFTPVAAFLSEELLRNGVEEAPSDAFDKCEPLIDIALQRASLSDESIKGLIGELMFLEYLLKNAETNIERSSCIEAWKGFEKKACDFDLSTCQLEVKVSSGEESKHHVSNLSQVDPIRTTDGEPLYSLYLFSVGLSQPTESSGTVSVPALTERILLHLGAETGPNSRNAIQELFLRSLEKYGSSNQRGYKHDEMKDWSEYRKEWSVLFERVYDMGDESIEVLRRSDIDSFSFVERESPKFVINLPDEIADGNPALDIDEFVRTLNMV